ncbi:unnamed protein product [Allacma fusca]|uniref:Uncharacterized protein n=1 Tax=Allacma fusca TaxID=39272 RepID=A0A8J2J4P2_9HEXA|nr:unnamed protein product [Allacma fusca]
MRNDVQQQQEQQQRRIPLENSRMIKFTSFITSYHLPWIALKLIPNSNCHRSSVSFGRATLGNRRYRSESENWLKLSVSVGDANISEQVTGSYWISSPFGTLHRRLSKEEFTLDRRRQC